MDLSAFYAGLLTARSAEQRVRGIGEWAEYFGDDTHLLPLLDDDAPVVRSHAGRPHLVEVRAVALVALQDRHRGAGHGWPYGPVVVRRAMPADVAAAQALAALDRLDPARREALVRQVEARLAEQVDPAPADREACRDYATLLALGLVSYERQEVDPERMLTPTQVAVHASQLRSPRPMPHVRFDGPDGPVGYLFREHGRWVSDLDESPLGRQVARFLGHLVTTDLPRWTGPVADRAAELAHLHAVAAEVSPVHPCVVVADGR